MTVLLVGADNLGNIPQELEEHGCHKVIHWDARKKATAKKDIPAKTDMIVIFHDFISHSIMNTVKEKAKKLGLPIIFSKRSTSDIKEKLTGASMLR